MRLTCGLLVVALCVAGPADAATQTVLGKSFVVRDPAPGVDPSLRSVVVQGKELTSTNTIVGDPLTNGASIEVLAYGDSSTTQTFTLPPGVYANGSGWKTIGSPLIGYSYGDRLGVNGPVKSALIRKTTSGTFWVKVTLKGALGPGPQPHITVVPPAPGVGGGIHFAINGGDTYCVTFGGVAGGAVTNTYTHGTTFKVATKLAAPTTEAGCPAVPQPCAFVTKWGSLGSNDGEFDSPTGIAVDGNGDVYVADRLNDRVQKFDGNGSFLTRWGTTGTGDGEFINPTVVAADPSGNVYVGDFSNFRVEKFTNDGTFLTAWGSFGMGDGQFRGMYGLAADGNGDIYVTDYYNHRLQKFDSNGAFLTKWGTASITCAVGDGELCFPAGIVVDSGGNVYVADSGNGRIQKFTSSGTFLAKWGTPGNGCGSGNGEFCSPFGVAVDANANVYVSETPGNRIQKFTSGGTYLIKWGSTGSGDGEFDEPYANAMDGSGNLYVVEEGNNRVQKFACP